MLRNVACCATDATVATPKRLAVAAQLTGFGPAFVGTIHALRELKEKPFLLCGPAVKEGGDRDIDNRDGTVTDAQRALTWEKKTDDGSIHDRDD